MTSVFPPRPLTWACYTNEDLGMSQAGREKSSPRSGLWQVSTPGLEHGKARARPLAGSTGPKDMEVAEKPEASTPRKRVASALSVGWKLSAGIVSREMR